MLIRIVAALCLAGSFACAPAIDATVSDAAIIAAVKTALLNQPDIDGTLITVRSVGGVVGLSGTQPSEIQAARVVEIVRGVQGVRDVQSTIAVDADAAAGELPQAQPPGTGSA